MRARAFWPCLEKSQLMSAYGATVQRLRPVSITHRDHFVNVVGLGDLPHAARRSPPAPSRRLSRRRTHASRGCCIHRMHPMHQSHRIRQLMKKWNLSCTLDLLLCSVMGCHHAQMD